MWLLVLFFITLFFAAHLVFSQQIGLLHSFLNVQFFFSLYSFFQDESIFCFFMVSFFGDDDEQNVKLSDNKSAFLRIYCTFRNVLLDFRDYKKARECRKRLRFTHGSNG